MAGSCDDRIQRTMILALAIRHRMERPAISMEGGATPMEQFATAVCLTYEKNNIYSGGSSMDKQIEESEPKKQEEEWLDVSEIDSILERSSFANRKQGVVSHKGISAKRVSSVKEKPVGLSKPRKKQMPDVNYLLVDGYNIIFAWEELKVLAQSDIAAARGKLMDILCNYQGFHKCELILVFDAYRVANHKTEILDYHNIHVVYTKEAETADQYIEKFAHENGKKYRITVATSDGLEQIIIRGAGCRLLSARDFEADVKRSEQAIREILKEQ